MTAAVCWIPSQSPSGIDWRSLLGPLRGNTAACFAMEARHRADNPAPVSKAIDENEVDDIRQARTGDGHSFERIVCRHQQEIARRLRRFSRDPSVLEDLVQETFVQAYFSLHRFRGETPLIHWLHRIAVRSGYRFWKINRSRSAHVSIDGLDPAAPQPSSDEASELLERVMSKLSPRDRLVLTLIYLEGHDVAETAALTGWSRTMVKVQAYRARGRLRKWIERERAGEPRGRN
ncbi:MAG: RNA polymerase sigma factor [Chthoniobacterales bacterium]|nr:RNA polymerase sigma factor [Chthoniobacterales bacterium]